MSYRVYVVSDGREQIFKGFDAYSEAIMTAKSLLSEMGNQSGSGNMESVCVKAESDGRIMWSSEHSPRLRLYEEFDREQWANLTGIDHGKTDKQSVYFDIDGTLGYWYQDARGMVYPDEVLDPRSHYFRTIAPHPFMIELAEKLSEDYDVCIVGAADKDTILDKFEWVNEHCPFIKDENIFFCPLGADKANYVKGNAERSVLIDDYNKNLNEWKGIPIKAVNSINSRDDNRVCIDGYAAEQSDDEYFKQKVMHNAYTAVSVSLFNERFADSVLKNYNPDRIDCHTFQLDNQNAVISTVKLSKNDYETVVFKSMYTHGEEYLKELHATDLDSALKNHSSMIEEYRENKNAHYFMKAFAVPNCKNGSEIEKEVPKKTEISIYQLKPEASNLLFLSYDEVSKIDTITRNNYKCVYTYTLPEGSGINLEDIYAKFNIDRPSDFRGHSLSMSDIIVVDEGGDSSAYYCDRFGFKSLDDFTEKTYSAKELNQMLNGSVSERVAVAQSGNYLDTLVHDNSVEVLCAVAEQGRPQDLDILVNNANASVRKAVAQIGRDEDLDILVDDEDSGVREEVAVQGRAQDLSILVKDEEPLVRMAVARHARPQDLEKLADDVSDAVKEVVFEKNNELIDTSVGKIPRADYFEMVISQYGYDSYSQMIDDYQAETAMDNTKGPKDKVKMKKPPVERD